MGRSMQVSSPWFDAVVRVPVVSWTTLQYAVCSPPVPAGRDGVGDEYAVIRPELGPIPRARPILRRSLLSRLGHILKKLGIIPGLAKSFDK